MKKLVSLIFVILFTMILTGCGQPKVANSKLVYTKIIKHEKKQLEAYELSKMWLANAFNDSKAVIEYDNKTNSTIIGKGIIPRINYAFLVYGDTSFTISISNKDNKSRIIMKNISIATWDKINGKLKYDMWNLEQFNIFTKEADKLTASFSSYVNDDSNNASNSNW